VPIALGLLAPWRYLGHRGPFHSIALALLAGGVAYLARWRALSHLVADDLASE
jgi:membrane-bound metal-dependent hydrolase YbcI (DUF457 family)